MVIYLKITTSFLISMTASGVLELLVHLWNIKKKLLSTGPHICKQRCCRDAVVVPTERTQDFFYLL